jgi:hypothetical protein
MPSTWAPNDWLSTDAITHTALNNIGNSIRTWGYGSTAGSVTINANKNAIAALGPLTFDATGYVNGILPINPTAPSSTSGSRSNAQYVQVIEAGNAIILQSELVRVSAGTGHGTLAHRIRRKVDVTDMGYIEFGSTYVSIGGGPLVLPVILSATYANDSAAAAGGVAVGSVYRNGSVLQIRVS